VCITYQPPLVSMTKHADQPAKKRETPYRISTCCLCWTAVVRNEL